MLAAFLAIHHRHGRHHWPMPKGRRDVSAPAAPAAPAEPAPR
jgi:hypothetical protein